MNTVTMYSCSGWQNVADYSPRHPFPIRVVEIPEREAHAVTDYTHARNESLDDLIQNLKDAAGIDTVHYKVI